MFTHPSESYLIFEDRLTKADGTAYANADEVALTNNAIMHLFSRIKDHLSNQLIESLSYPGQATTMLGLLKYPDGFSKVQGLNQMWYKDTVTTATKADNNEFAARHAYLSQSPTVKGTFYFRIPLKHIFGFCEDYEKIVYALKHSLTLVRKTDADAIFRGSEKFSIYKTIETNIKLPVAYRTRQCDMLSVLELTSFIWRLSVKTEPKNLKFIIVGFQTDKDGDQTKNPSTFDHVNLKMLM